MQEKNYTIIHAFPTWLPQTQTWMHSQVLELQRLGVDAQVVCERIENLDQFGVANIHSLGDESRLRQMWDKGIRKLRLRRYLHHLVRVGRNIKADIVHSHFGNVGWANLGAVKRIGAKHVVTFYGLDVNKLPLQNPVWRERYAELFAKTDLFLCEGSYMAKSLESLGCPAEKIRVQHLGVDVEKIDFQPRNWSKSEPLKVLIAASFREKKGIPYAIDALGKLQAHVPIELTIIGDASIEPESQAEKAYILSALKKTGLIANTRMLGYQPHEVMLKEAYDHHIFLHPSVTAANGDTEGGAPVCITEMLATGMPVVSTWHCDIPEVVGSRSHSLLAEERDVDGLVNCIVRLLDKNEDWGKLASAGRLHIESEYHRVKQAKRLVALYKSLLDIS